MGPGSGPRFNQSRAQTVDQLPVLRRQVVHEAVDRLDDDTPLGETGHGGHGIQSRLHFLRHADTELRIVLDLLSNLRTGGGTAGSPSALRSRIVSVAHKRSSGTAEIHALRCVSDTRQKQSQVSTIVTIARSCKADSTALRPRRPCHPAAPRLSNSLRRRPEGFEIDGTFSGTFCPITRWRCSCIEAGRG